MSEVFPRWNLPPVDFLEVDAEKVKHAMITDFEKISGRTLAVGDPVRLFLLSVAAEIVRMRCAVNVAAQQNLLTYAQGGNLDALGLLLDTARLPASKALTKLKFTLAKPLGEVYTIPAGTQVTNGVVTFATIESLAIGIGEITGEVDAESVVAGSSANGYIPGQITTLVVPLVFVKSVENTITSAGGSDIESDADYAERVRIAPNSFSVAGPEKAYIFHARSVLPAIIDVSVVSPSPGEVHIYPLLTDGELPSSSVLKKVQEHLSDETVRPLTDHVVVKAPQAVQYSIEVHYWISKEDVARVTQRQRAVEDAVEQYRLWQQSKIGRDIAPEKLIQMIVSAGAIRVDHDRMQPPAFRALDAVSVAQCSGVNVVYEGIKDE